MAIGYKIIKDFLLDLIFPKYCVGCEKEGTWLCKDCLKKITLIKKPFCPLCNRLTPKGQFCSRCRTKTELTGVLIAAYYKDGPIKEAIHTFKYDGVYDLSEDLGEIIIHALEKRSIKKGYILVPVPLHKNRHKQRGFNQSELLAEYLIRKYPKFKYVKNKLIRVKQSPHQVDLNREERLKNAQGQFDWISSKNELKNKKIILVDDIYTTGATLNECAKILRKKAGVKEVWGLVIAKH